MADGGEEITHQLTTALTPASVNEEAENNNGEEVKSPTKSMEEKTNDPGSVSNLIHVDENKKMSHTEEPLSSEKDDPLSGDDDGGGLSHLDESHGDHNRQSSKDQITAPETLSGGEQMEEEEEEEEEETPATTTPPVQGQNQADLVDGLSTQLDNGSPVHIDTNTKAVQEVAATPGDVAQTSKTSGQKFSPEENPEGGDSQELGDNVTNIGFITEEPTEASLPDRTETPSISVKRLRPKDLEPERVLDPTEEPRPKPPENSGGVGGYLVMIVMVTVVIVAMLVQHLRSEPPPVQDEAQQQVDVFLKQMEKVKTQFPNQRVELWKRSRIHLQRHLQTAQPLEPVSLILTAGLQAQGTLHCLARGLASAFSAARNASVLLIDGAVTNAQDSDQVKLDIDSKLQAAFEGNTPVAVIHRFEELPPGSTLIFYRYCDHENAAYKKTFLIFTVLLGEEEDVPAGLHLSAVEEMVDDHLQRKFLSHGHPASFDKMDRDKYGGLWSRISHLILPVAMEKKIEDEGCERTLGDAHFQLQHSTSADPL